MILRSGLPLIALSAALIAAPPDPNPAFFESTVKPILRASCQGCHNQNNRTSGLALDNRADTISGGNRGALVTVGDASKSLLMAAVEQSGDLKMPPGGKLKEEQIAALRTWINEGLAWSEEQQSRKPKGWDHWAFQAPKRVPPPAVNNGSWAKNEIDRFVLATLEAKKIDPSPETDRYTLLRRVSLDLTGLPPTPAEIASFINDKSPTAYAKVVDRLLASPHYGERWGRHWLDLARYADSDGYAIDDPRQIWKYRDWVIQALNKDQRFDEFTIEQLAGDLLPKPTRDQLIATGFHRNTPSNFEGGTDQEQYRNEAVADRVATTGSVFLGLSLGCARCHDHKYDPVTQREFYQIFAYFNNTAEITKDSERSEFNRPILQLPTDEEKKQLADYDAELKTTGIRVAEAAKAKSPEVKELSAKLRTLQRSRPPVTYTLIMREIDQPRPAYIHLGGDFTRKGAPVQPATIASLGAKIEGGNRLDLAKWIVNPKNPLTARVTVNRIWQAYFGKGLVETENDFGLMGSAPTHPELLDWLATEFVAQNWSMKAMHRLIVMSSTYRQSSKQRPDLEAIDPYNNLLARQTRFRVEAESARDVALVASGLLNPAVGGPSVYPPIPLGAMATTQIRKPWPTSTGSDRYRRGLYTFAYRSGLHPALSLFDAPDGTATCTRRVRSNTPLQALSLLNDTAFTEAARALATRVAKESKGGDKEKLQHAFVLATGRPPSEFEAGRLASFLALQRDEFSDVSAAKLLLGGSGDARSMAETVEAASGMGGGAQSAAGKAFTQAAAVRAKEELARAKILAEERNAAIEKMPAAELRELAAWTAVGRVLLNLDDTVTRN